MLFAKLDKNLDFEKIHFIHSIHFVFSINTFTGNAIIGKNKHVQDLYSIKYHF